jgi:ribosomal protein L37AE/L43A
MKIRRIENNSNGETEIIYFCESCKAEVAHYGSRSGRFTIDPDMAIKNSIPTDIVCEACEKEKDFRKEYNLLKSLVEDINELLQITQRIERNSPVHREIIKILARK